MINELTSPDRTSVNARTRHRLLAVAVAVAAPLLVWIVAYAAGVDFRVTSPAVGRLQITVPLVIVSTVPIALAG